jgi:hypothetical protein
MLLMDRQPLIDEALEVWQPALGAAGKAYRGHVYRVFNFARSLLGSERHDGELALASAFHDIGIWSDATFDYLEPSIRRAGDHLRARQLGLPVDLIADLIRNHHLLRRVRGGGEAHVIEAFRRADLTDVSRGLLRGALDAGFLREVVAAFPYAGFHGALLREALSWCLRHPLRPLPTLRLRQSRPSVSQD